jgi:hypothetical protein
MNLQRLDENKNLNTITNFEEMMVSIRKFNAPKMAKLMSGAAAKIEKPETFRQSLEKAPRAAVIVGSVAISLAISAFVNVLIQASGK